MPGTEAEFSRRSCHCSTARRFYNIVFSMKIEEIATFLEPVTINWPMPRLLFFVPFLKHNQNPLETGGELPSGFFHRHAARRGYIVKIVISHENRRNRNLSRADDNKLTNATASFLVPFLKHNQNPLETGGELPSGFFHCHTARRG